MLLTKTVIKIIKVYQHYISPGLPSSCRYYPSCSTYTIDCIKKRGLARGLIQGLLRILRCNAFFPGGIDETP